MIQTSENRISCLLNPNVKKSGSDFTTMISDLGDGSMAEGIWRLWKDGERTGMAKGITFATLAIGTGLGICRLIQIGVHSYKVRHAVRKVDADKGMLFKSSQGSVAPQDNHSTEDENCTSQGTH